MSKRVFIPGLSVFCALAMISSIAATAMAQQVPVRVVQSSDGTMYVLQGSNSWTLVPDQISDSDAAALAPGGEIDGTLPDQLVASQPSAPPPAQQPAPAPPAPQPAPAPPPAPAPQVITGSADLTGGKASSDIDNPTAIAVGATITSIVDIHTRPHDVYSINLTAGTKYTMSSSSTNKYSGAAVEIHILNPDRTEATVLYPGGYYSSGCTTISNTPCVFLPAITATYVLDARPQAVTQNYTFTIKQS